MIPPEDQWLRAAPVIAGSLFPVLLQSVSSRAIWPAAQVAKQAPADRECLWEEKKMQVLTAGSWADVDWSGKGNRDLGRTLAVPATMLPEKNTQQFKIPSVLFGAQSCPTLCDPMNRSMPGLPVHHQLPEFTQIHVHRVGDAIQPSHLLSSPSPPAPNPSQHQGLSDSEILALQVWVKDNFGFFIRLSPLCFQD